MNPETARIILKAVALADGIMVMVRQASAGQLDDAGIKAEWNAIGKRQAQLDADWELAGQPPVE